VKFHNKVVMLFIWLLHSLIHSSFLSWRILSRNRSSCYGMSRRSTALLNTLYNLCKRNHYNSVHSGESFKKEELVEKVLQWKAKDADEVLNFFYRSFLQLIRGECNLFLQILAKGVFLYFFQNKQQFFWSYIILLSILIMWIEHSTWSVKLGKHISYKTQWNIGRKIIFFET
jgi:hypothetical protein